MLHIDIPVLPKVAEGAFFFPGLLFYSPVRSAVDYGARHAAVGDPLAGPAR